MKDLTWWARWFLSPEFLHNFVDVRLLSSALHLTVASLWIAHYQYTLSDACQDTHVFLIWLGYTIPSNNTLWRDSHVHARLPIGIFQSQTSVFLRSIFIIWDSNNRLEFQILQIMLWKLEKKIWHFGLKNQYLGCNFVTSEYSLRAQLLAQPSSRWNLLDLYV